MSTQTEELFKTLETQGDNDRYFLPLENDLVMEESIADSEEDKSKKAHFISPAMNVVLWNRWGLSNPGGPEGVKLLVQLAAKAGEELVALCEYRWVPSGSPSSQDACQACLTIAGEWIAADE
jgi:hypothetical protein